mmetsp:Transcript_614/g.1390  ORF Transcript_614/g.1390 Transcript_614/m.1390 type:complete len:278 (+) Transcript_614:533-1366(+)
MRRHAVTVSCPLSDTNSALQIRSLLSTSSLRMCVSRISFNALRPVDAKRKLLRSTLLSVTSKPISLKKVITSESVSSYRSLRGRLSNRSKALLVGANNVSFRASVVCKFRMPSGISILGTIGCGKSRIWASKRDASKPETPLNPLTVTKISLFKMANSTGDAVIKVQRVPNKVSFSTAQINSARVRVASSSVGLSEGSSEFVGVSEGSSVIVGVSEGSLVSVGSSEGSSETVGSSEGSSEMVGSSEGSAVEGVSEGESLGIADGSGLGAGDGAALGS